MKTAIIYHQVKPGIDCADGIAAAWVAKRKYPGSDLIGASYGGEIPVLGEYDENSEFQSNYDRVLVVDFSFSRDVLEAWNLYFELSVIDHHKTALQQLEGFSAAIFDMNESGATLTWKTLFPDEAIPAFLDYVKDRDLWNFVLPDSEEIHEAMSFTGRKLFQLDFLATLSMAELRSLLAPLGAKLLEPKRKRIAEIADTALPQMIKGRSAIAVEIPETESRLSSDVCAFLYSRHPEVDFVLGYSRNSKENVWALAFRSDKNGNDFDVSAIAQMFGGGGHRNAAGAKADDLAVVFGY